MGRRTLLAALCLAFGLGTGGCMAQKQDTPGSTQKPVKAKKQEDPQCKPNQEWDGEKCRHKGKGHGARKHDD